MHASALLIGDVAKRTGFPAATIRYYESIGLLKVPSRAQSGYRTYPASTVDELLFIRKAQTLGFSLSEVGEILRLSRAGKRPCDRVLTLSRGHLKAVDNRIHQLQKFRNALASELAKWDTAGSGAGCEGLCRLISDADDTIASPEPVDRAPLRRRRTT